jgi:hypothetical protein
MYASEHREFLCVEKEIATRQAHHSGLRERNNNGNRTFFFCSKISTSAHLSLSYMLVTEVGVCQNVVNMLLVHD